ncbi:hypothetical protein LUQ84_003347 [Hamiltosporidium tvaerminnensis]|nr:hypothetical protein LUQ84_003347 [Hamiltosporidium tvaerminnensis]
MESDVNSPLVSPSHACSLTDTTLYMNLREKFLCKIKELSEKEIENVVVRTRKLPSELVESKVLELINQITGKYAESHVPKNVSDAARIIQAAQKGYDEETRKEKPRSAWKENIESKISKLVLFKDLLEKARKQEKLSTSETKSLKKIMREFNLNLSSVTDLSEALVKKNEVLMCTRKKLRCMKVGSNSEKRIVCLSFFKNDFIVGYLSVWSPSMWLIVMKL